MTTFFLLKRIVLNVLYTLKVQPGVFDQIIIIVIIFTPLHVMQTRYCDEISVCPSVRPSVCLPVCHTRGL